MQNWFRRKELVSPPYDKCGIFAKQDLEFHAGDLIGSEHRQECLKREARKLGAGHGQPGSYRFVRRISTDKQPRMDCSGHVPSGRLDGTSRAAYAASRISSNLKGTTKQFGWLQAPATHYRRVPL